MSAFTDVLFAEHPGAGGNLGVMTLNRPQVLNSLDDGMIRAMLDQLTRWGNDAKIKAVVVQAAEGRAFCAGGDIRMVYDKARAHLDSMTDFFFHEYHLNRAIYHFPKPYIALMDGITMGGGVGISLHGSHRVGTERLLFAMPETGIGFFPDVGGTYFLPRIQDHIGYYLGLTGARIKVDDSLLLKIVTQKIHHEKLPNVLQGLIDTDLGDDPHRKVTEFLNMFAEPPVQSELASAATDLNHCFSATTMEGIIERLVASTTPLCKQALETLYKKSPTALKVTLAALINGDKLNFDECMQQEYRLVTRFLLEHDFIEGIRAVIIDKDQSPVWRPAKLSEVSDAAIQAYFAPLKKELA